MRKWLGLKIKEGKELIKKVDQARKK